MKISLLSLALLVLVGCEVTTVQPERIETNYLETREFRLCNPYTNEGDMEWNGCRWYDVNDSIQEIQRDLKALKNKVMGIETGCRINKTTIPKCELCDHSEYSSCNCGKTIIETICKGDTKTVDSYMKIQGCEDIDKYDNCIIYPK